MKLKEQAQILAEHTEDAFSADAYTNWQQVCLMMLRRGFSMREAEAWLRSKHTRWCRDGCDKHTDYYAHNSACFARYLDSHGYKPGDTETQELVVGTYEHELKIHSLHDAQAECTCGEWSYASIGQTTEQQVRDEWQRHLEGGN